MKMLKVIGILVIICIILLIYNYLQISTFKIRNVKIESEKIKSDIKITQISDFHSNGLIDIEKLNSQIKSFNPDFIVLTGDIIDRDDEKLDKVFKLLDSITNLKKDIYYVKGNHEKFHPLYDDLKHRMEKLEIVVLEDENREISINDEKINITGLDFVMKSEEYTEIERYGETIKDIDTDRYNILLRHSPNDVTNILKGNEDLILSGHTHGGQVRLPIIGSIVAPGQGFFPEYDKGLFTIKNADLYIDSGLGNSTLALRLFNPVQFSNITITGKNSIKN